MMKGVIGDYNSAAKKHKLEYWCRVCDSKVINAQDPESGDWFQVFGHVWPGTNVEYTSVIFAVCKQCQEKE